ncbi:hypothetical protein N7471_002272 [Penicillium samsonianum]|uniref:uncharacterized protein n=1 Tax=Penicillium samsonianum TaxID=1882272 RepID=UPI002548DBD7|nr:uncharacterized protein N7471_002272 [Penicillium samsonianum]KAJ6142819.1 hypothetical protein N7471_002272 [Penicillium samsonianum]
MDRQVNTAIRLAYQLDSYIQAGHLHADEFDADTRARIALLLSQHPKPHLPKSEDPFPSDWPIDRPALHKATTAFLKAASSIVIESTSLDTATDPKRPLGPKTRGSYHNIASKLFPAKPKSRKTRSSLIRTSLPPNTFGR